MNMRKMRYFADAVELGSFSVVAKKNYISQTAISQQIMSVEREVGTALFERDNTGVRVNAAGRIFYSFCKKTLVEYDKTVAAISAVVNEGKGTLTLAITQAHGMIIPEILTVFIRKYPDVHINVKCAEISALPEQIENGNVDFAVGPVYDFEQNDTIKYEILYSEDPGVIMSKNNALAEKEDLTLRDIAGETVIELSREGGLRIREHLVKSLKKLSFSPRKTIQVADMKSQAVLVAANVGIAFVTENANIDSENNLFRRISDYNDPVDVALAWKNGNTDKAVENFLKCCLG